MQFSLMYVKMMGVNNDSGVVHSAITRRQYDIRHVPSHQDIVKWYNMFLENGLQMPYTGGRRCDRNKEEDIRQAMMQSP